MKAAGLSMFGMCPMPSSQISSEPFSRACMSSASSRDVNTSSLPTITRPWYCQTCESRLVRRPLVAPAHRRDGALRVGRSHHRQHVVGDGGKRLDAPRREHFGKEFLRVPLHSLPQKPVGHGGATSLALLGFPLCHCRRQEESPDPLGILTSELHDDLPAHRQTAEDDRVNAEAVEQCGKIGGERFEAGDAGYYGGLAISPKVRRDHSPAGTGHRGELGTPHGPVERSPVNQQQRIATSSLVVEGDTDAVGRDTGHRLGYDRSGVMRSSVKLMADAVMS